MVQKKLKYPQIRYEDLVENAELTNTDFLYDVDVPSTLEFYVDFYSLINEESLKPFHLDYGNPNVKDSDEMDSLFLQNKWLINILDLIDYIELGYYEYSNERIYNFFINNIHKYCNKEETETILKNTNLYKELFLKKIPDNMDMVFEEVDEHVEFQEFVFNKVGTDWKDPEKNEDIVDFFKDWTNEINTLLQKWCQKRLELKRNNDS